jgi:S1-C subfamily serine protease
MNPETLSQSVVKLRAVVPEDAFTAGILGSERIGNGVVIGADGLILTIGYLITEARDVWLTVHGSNHEVAAHALAYDQVTGFGLVVPLEDLHLEPLKLGSSDDVRAGSKGCVLSSGELAKSQSVHVLARREFAGAWEYLLDNALFTIPAHSHWSGAALINESGNLVGLGSLLVREVVAGEETNVNMFVPTDLLKPILEDLRMRGRVSRRARPWLGVYAVEVSGRLYVSGVAEGSPAQLADMREGDIISHVANHEVVSLADFYRRVWALGPASVAVPLTTIRGGTRLVLSLKSMDRDELLKRPLAN